MASLIPVHAKAALQDRHYPRAIRRRIRAAYRPDEFISFFETSLDLLAVAHANGYFIRVNHAFTEVLGWTEREMLASPWLDFVHPDDRQATIAVGSGIFERRTVRAFANRYRCRDGSFRWLEWQAVLALDGAHIYAIARDVTPHLEAERALARAHAELADANERLARREAAAVQRAMSSEVELRDVIDNLPDLAWTARPDGHVDFYNRRWFEYTGKTPAESQGSGWQTVHDPEVLPRVIEAWRRMLATGEPLEMEFPLRGADGAYRWFLTRMRPLRDATGQIVRWFGCSTNIDDSRRLRLDLARSRARYRATFEQANVGIGEVALDGRWTKVNDRLAEILGYTRAEMVQLTTSDVMHPDDYAGDAALATELLRGERSSISVENRCRRKDGSQVWAHLTVAVVRTAAGEPDYFVIVVEDVDELHTLRQVLEERVARRTADLEAANRELETFSYSVSHALRAPLRAISGFSRALREEAAPQLDEQSLHYLARIEAGAVRMGQLIDELLALARVARAPVTRVGIDLTEMVRSICASLEDRERRQPKLEVAEGVRGSGDAGLVRIALENLLGNAFKFTRERAEPHIGFGVTNEGGERRYFVRDNGAGFDMAHAKNLFGAFQRLHPAARFEGNGIGLATVQRIVARHGGRLWAESTPDVGSTFWFTLGPDDREGAP